MSYQVRLFRNTRIAAATMLFGACAPSGSGNVVASSEGGGGTSLSPVSMQIGFSGQTSVLAQGSEVTGALAAIEGGVSNRLQFTFFTADGSIIAPRQSDFVTGVSQGDSIADWEEDGAFAGRVVGVAPGVTSIVFSYKTSSNSTAYVSPPIPVVVTPSSVALNE